MNEQELQQLKFLFEKNKNNAVSIRSQILIESVNHVFWSYSPSYSLAPFEIECNGFSLGKIYKTEPKQKANSIEYGFIDNKIVYIYNYGPKGTPNSINYFLWKDGEVEFYLFVKGYNNEPTTLTTVGTYFLNKKQLPIVKLSYFQDYYDEDDEPSNYDIIKKMFTYEDVEKVSKITVRGYIERSNKKIERDTDYTIFYSDSGELDYIEGKQNNMNNDKVQVYPR